MAGQVKYKYSKKRRENIGKGITKRWKEHGHPR